MTTDWNTLYDKIIVRRHEADKMVKGIAVAETHERTKNTGIVVSVGNGRIVAGSTGGPGFPPDGPVTQPLTIRPGMEVLFHEHSGVPLEPDDDSVIILREDEILAYRDVPTPLAAVV